MSSSKNVTLEHIVALCKRKGFVYPSSEIYGGLNGVYDFGPLGVLLKQNLRNLWIESVQNEKGEVVQIEGALLGPQVMWEASGHTKNFHDPMVDCLNCKHRYRADHIDLTRPCEHCGKTSWTAPRNFNMMFETNLGAASDNASLAYLRPETAQSVFINFKQIVSSIRIKIPFGAAQIGKAFRNEITPKQFLFRMREFEQMELEWFCKPEDAESFFHFWQKKRLEFYNRIGIDQEKIRIRKHESDELSHYSSQTSDVEYQFPFGWKELEGIADRGNFDLSQHTQYSGKELGIHDDIEQRSYIPHVIESSVGTDRLFLTTLFDAYYEDSIDGEIRVVLKFKPIVAPIKAAFFPLTKKQLEPMLNIYADIKKQTGFSIQFDESGSIGKRYRRQDEIGTPFCFTYDFDSEMDNMVTVRDRDTTQQTRIPITSIVEYLKKHIV